MNLNFTSPAFLLALPSVFLPVLLHLLARRKEKPLVFSSVIFLKEAARRTHSFSKLATFLLLLLRMLFILFFLFFLSGPVMSPANKDTAAQKAATVIVLDASASMRRKINKNETAFDAAKKLILQKLSQMPKDVPVMLYLAKNPPLQKQIFLSQDSGSLRASIESLKPSYSKSHLTQTIFIAVRYLHSQNEPGKELLVLSDFQKKDFEPAQMQAIPENIHVTFISFAGKNNKKNARVELSTNKKVFFKGVPISFNATGDMNKHSSVTVKIYFQKNIISEKKVQSPFTITPSNSGYYCVQSQAVQDDFPPDDTSSFCFKAQYSIKMLVIGEKKKTFYLAHALHAAKNSLVLSLSPSFVTPDATSKTSFSDYDSLILADVPDFPLSEVIKAVSRGRGLVVFLGDGIKADFYKTKFLPYFNVSLKKAVSIPSSVLSVSSPDSPLLLSLPAHDLQRAFSLQFVKAWDMNAPYPGHAAVLLNNRIPFLAETSYKKGKVILVNTSVTPVHSNLVLSASFVPLLINMIFSTSPVSYEDLNLSADVRNVPPGIKWDKNNRGMAINLPSEESQSLYSMNELRKIFPKFTVQAADSAFHADENVRAVPLALYFFALALLIFLCETYLSSRSVMQTAENI